MGLAFFICLCLFYISDFLSYAGIELGSSLPFTDRDLLVATQIAYYDFDQTSLSEGESLELSELLKKSQIEEKLNQSYENAEEEELRKQMAEGSLDLYKEICSEDSAYGHWKIVNVRDLNAEKGFYAVLIDTGNDCAILAFRGSESTDTNQLVKDWMNADFGLLMDHDTVQQEEAKKYLADIESQYSYKTYAVTGHSLGGNLAEHAVLTASDSMKDKIVQMINFDGPGYSKTYIERHSEEISKVTTAISHYKWSLVGELLTQPDCVTSKTVKVVEAIKPYENINANYLRHAVFFVDLKENSVQESSPDLFSLSMGIWSQKVDAEIIQQRNKM